jgi:outer membrane protein assembly factor BamD (BamD/ComL family)
MNKIFYILFPALFLFSCGGDKEKENKVNKDSLADAELMKDPKNYFKDCKALFAKATKVDSILYTQTEINKNTANEAIKAFSDYAYYCANDSLSPIFLIKTAQVAVAINNIVQAKLTLEKCIETYPKFEGLPAAMFLLGQLYDEKEYLNDEQEAKRIYEDLIAKYPNSPEAESAKGAIRFLGMSDKQIINQLNQEKNSTPKVNIQ